MELTLHLAATATEMLSAA